jgi:dihydroorotase
MSRILIRGGRVVDPASNLDRRRDVLIEGGKIAKIGARLSAAGARLIDASGMLVSPGLIDLHTHLRDPGRPDKETIASGARAAALGGFTSICCMANTDPPADNPAVVEYIIAKAKAEAPVNIFPIAAITRGLKGEEMAEMGRCYNEGAVAFSDDGRPVMRADVMRRAVEYAKQFGAFVISHCQDVNLSHSGFVNESAFSTAMGMQGVSPLAEEIMVAREILMAREYGRVHIAHVSSAGAVKLIRRAKREGIPVTCETCPHYFSLTEEAIKNYDTNAKVNPPLRTRADLKEVLRGLKDGTIDAIATDHAPHNIEEKNIEFDLASSGMVGLETALGLALTRLVLPKVLTIKQMIAKFTLAPARILRMPKKGNLKVGSDADIIVISDREWEVDPSKFASRSRNTPFAGWKLCGKVLYTIVGGRIVVKDGKLV